MLPGDVSHLRIVATDGASLRSSLIGRGFSGFEIFARFRNAGIGSGSAFWLCFLGLRSADADAIIRATLTAATGIGDMKLLEVLSRDHRVVFGSRCSLLEDYARPSVPRQISGDAVALISRIRSDGIGGCNFSDGEIGVLIAANESFQVDVVRDQHTIVIGKYRIDNRENGEVKECGRMMREILEAVQSTYPNSPEDQASVLETLFLNFQAQGLIMKLPVLLTAHDGDFSITPMGFEVGHQITTVDKDSISMEVDSRCSTRVEILRNGEQTIGVDRGGACRILTTNAELDRVKLGECEVTFNGVFKAHREGDGFTPLKLRISDCEACYPAAEFV
jgi:hypothetical protein